MVTYVVLQNDPPVSFVLLLPYAAWGCHIRAPGLVLRHPGTQLYIFYPTLFYPDLQIAWFSQVCFLRALQRNKSTPQLVLDAVSIRDDLSPLEWLFTFIPMHFFSHLNPFPMSKGCSAGFPRSFVSFWLIPALAEYLRLNSTVPKNTFCSKWKKA